MAAIQELAERVKPEGDGKCYVDVDAGLDESSADGSESMPYKSLAYAMVANIDRPTITYLTRASKTGDDPAAAQLWKEPAKSAVKKATSAVDAHKKKMAKKAASDAKEEEAKKARLNNLEEAKKVVIKQDPSLPEAKRIRIDDKSVELGEGDKKGARVKVYGRIDQLRPQKQAVSFDLAVFPCWSSNLADKAHCRPSFPSPMATAPCSAFCQAAHSPRPTMLSPLPEVLHSSSTAR